MVYRDKSMARIQKILIVGGGTSGWLSAAYLARMMGTYRPGGAEITLVEASDIGTIGVGEATIPPIRTIVAALGIDEATFMQETSATYKLAIKFDNWLKNPKTDPHSYYHTFGKFSQVGADLMAAYWVMDRANTKLNFVDYTMMEGRLCDIGCGPKRIDDLQFQGPLQYAYHFDAGRLAKLLKKVSAHNGVKHLIGKVKNVVMAEDGSIAALETEEHGHLSADLYLDCTGFSAHLIEKAMKVPFHPYADILFCDKAVACQVAYEDPACEIPPYTTSTAQENGWTWDIPLNDRRGIGYVYSSRHTDKDRAEEVARGYIGETTSEYELVHLDMRVGSRREPWRKNCVAIGLSGGFVEPLESTGIYLVDIALRWLVDFMPSTESMELGAASFNKMMNACYADVVDFVKMHYCLSERTDTEFWIDNRRESSLPDSLLDKLESWRCRMPGIYEFTGIPNVFGLTNYMQVMYGMEFDTDLSGYESRYGHLDAARQQAQQFGAAAMGGAELLPRHRALIDQIYSGGFQIQKSQGRPGMVKRNS